jgi:hypothetical protein
VNFEKETDKAALHDSFHAYRIEELLLKKEWARE